MRLTSRGWMLLGASLVFPIIAILAGFPEFLGLSVAGLVLVGVAAYVVSSSRSDVSRPSSTRVERGRDEAVHVHVADQTPRALGVLRMRSRGRIGPQLVGLPRVARGMSVTASIPIPTRRRGPVVIGPWQVERVDAWALARSVMAVVPAVEITVVPRIYPLRLASLPTVVSRQRLPSHVDDSPSTLREYVVGDELRRIHWRSSARTGTLMVRQELETRRPGVHVILDVARSSYADPDQFEEAVDVAVSVAVAAASTGVPVDLRTTAGESVRAGVGRHSGVLDLLARVESVADGLETLGTCVASVTEGSVVVVSGPAGPARVLRDEAAVIIVGCPAVAGRRPMTLRPGLNELMVAADLGDSGAS